MWCANCFGLYDKEKNCISPSNIYFGSDDMTFGKSKKYQLINSSLNILKDYWDDTKYIQEDSNNCCLWALLTMFRNSWGYQDSVGKLSTEDLQKK